jgi:multiple sugar transport system substrate-binding protein
MAGGTLSRRALLRAGAATAVGAGATGAVGALGCRTRRRERDGALVFKHQPLWGDPAPFRAMLASFERASGVRVVTEVLPNASDVVHQYFLTALEGESAEFDVLVVDVVWVAELARAGWIADLSGAFAPDTLRRELLPGAADSVIVEGKTRAVPWYTDVGLLYRRADLAPDAPRTYDDLTHAIGAARRASPGMQGLLWQGKQYEGLVCNAYEAIWGHGGESLASGRLALDTAPARRGLTYLRSLIERGLSPRPVLSAAEEESRRAFQSGRAVFMRNWPYAWAESQAKGSPVRGKIAVSALPTETGAPGAGTLGGWQLAVNARSPPALRGAAHALIAHLTSLEANVMMAVHYARNPPREAAYEDARLRAEAPFIASLLPIVRHARPRPVTPYYAMLSDVLQSEFSGAIAGVRSPEEALARAQKLADHIMGTRG